uniref:Uncharacterized protein n=1 Tax=Arundo donax TaxID=35708 RepID=A0A0A8XUP6_ARUDO
MRCLVTQRRGTYMTNMGRMVSRREWEEVVTSIIRLTSLSNFLEVVPLEGVAQGYADRNVVRMWCIL